MEVRRNDNRVYANRNTCFNRFPYVVRRRRKKMKRLSLSNASNDGPSPPSRRDLSLTGVLRPCRAAKGIHNTAEKFPDLKPSI